MGSDFLQDAYEKASGLAEMLKREIDARAARCWSHGGQRDGTADCPDCVVERQSPEQPEPGATHVRFDVAMVDYLKENGHKPHTVRLEFDRTQPGDPIMIYFARYELPQLGFATTQRMLEEVEARLMLLAEYHGRQNTEHEKMVMTQVLRDLRGALQHLPADVLSYFTMGD